MAMWLCMSDGRGPGWHVMREDKEMNLYDTLQLLIGKLQRHPKTLR